MNWTLNECQSKKKKKSIEIYWVGKWSKVS